MARLAAVRCVLAVKDLPRSVAFYRDTLGFALEFEVAGWAFLSRDLFHVTTLIGEFTVGPRAPAGGRNALASRVRAIFPNPKSHGEVQVADLLS